MHMKYSSVVEDGLLYLQPHSYKHSDAHISVDLLTFQVLLQ
jgi:hypothetical protein